MTSRLPLLAGLFICVQATMPPLASPAAAGETIYDPENPGQSAEPESDEGEPSDDETQQTASAAPDADSSTEFRGTWAAGTAVDTHWLEAGDEDIIEWSGAVDLRLDHDLNPRTKVVLEGEFRLWAAGEENAEETDLLINAADPRASFQARLGEAYLVHRTDDWTVRAGHLVTRWGSTDLVRPGDVINPTDLTQLSGLATDDTMLPQLALEVGRVEPNWSLTALLVPFFKPNRVAVFGRDVALAVPQNPLLSEQFPVVSLLERAVDSSLYEEVQPLALAASQPDELPKNASLGLRFTGTRWNTDFGLGYFWGWDRTPWLRVDEDLRELIRVIVEDGRVLEDLDFGGFAARHPEVFEISERLADKRQAGEELIVSEYRRRHSLVADIARYIGPVGVRADLTFSPERTFVTRDLRSVRRPTFFGALGASWERLSAENPLAVTVEGFWMHAFAAEAGVTELFVAEGERGEAESELLLIGADLWGVSGAFNATLPWDLDLRLGGLATLSNGGVIVTGRLRKQWKPWLRTGIGATIYEGPDPAEQLSVGGLYDRNDQVVLSVGGQF